MSLRPELTNLWGLWRRVLNFLIWAQKGSVANIIANSNNVIGVSHPGISVFLGARAPYFAFPAI